MSAAVVVSAERVSRHYPGPDDAVVAVARADLEVSAGQALAIVGRSGSGKSTLLHLLAGLDRPTAGRVTLFDVDTSGAPDRALAAIRRRRLGIVFQEFNLVSTMTAWENVALPLLLDRARPRKARARAVVALDEVGLADRAEHRPGQLSGGEQQRVAIARALITSPALVLADEPTGSLDSRTATTIGQILFAAARSRAAALVVVTHDPAIARGADCLLQMNDGTLSPTPIGSADPRPTASTSRVGYDHGVKVVHIGPFYRSLPRDSTP